jgi:hypothetical protein
MPVSATEGKDIIKEWFSRQDIKTIVDVGAGAGTYPDLLGDKYEWIGIEAFEPYIKEYNLEDKYDKLILDDVRDIELPKGDCIIFGDVLEHMSKEDASKLLERAERFFEHIVVSIPLGYWPQGAVNGNEYEVHHAEWSPREAGEFFNHFAIKERIGHIGVYIK